MDKTHKKNYKLNNETEINGGTLCSFMSIGMSFFVLNFGGLVENGGRKYAW